MTTRQAALAAAIATTLGLGGAALAQTAEQSTRNPQPSLGGTPGGPTAQQINPSPMPPGSRAADAPGMSPGGNPGRTSQRAAPETLSDPAAPPPAGTTPGSQALGSSAMQTPAPTTPPSAPATVLPGSAAADAASVPPAGTPAPAMPGTLAQGSAPGAASDATPGTAPGRDAAQTPVPALREPSREGTGATTPGTAGQGGGAASTDPTPPAATTQHTEPRTGAAPVAGANSFTEGQARARMRDAGFGDVQELRLDDQGIWRGRGTREGQQTGVALDFQGNVVATP